MDEYLEERARHSTEEHPWQPQLLIIGNVMKPKRILAIVDLNCYTFRTLPEAVAVCFETFFWV